MFLPLLSDLISVRLSLLLPRDSHIYIYFSYLYIFTRYKTAIDADDFSNDFPKGAEGWREEAAGDGFFLFFYSKSSDPRPREGYRGVRKRRRWKERGEPPLLDYVI